MTPISSLHCALSLGLLWPLVGAAQPGCTSTPAVTDATPAQIHRYFQAQQKTVLTFVGYSGAGYEDPVALLAAASRVLRQYKPARTIVNIGATAEGIGAVYALAAGRGFSTTGIVSSQARANAVPLSPCVQQVFVVEDSVWGGLLPAGQGLSPTSQAMVANSHRIVAIGGGEVARDEFLEARKAGKKTRFIAADMQHAAAAQKAAQQGLPPPDDFRGALAAAL